MGTAAMEIIAPQPLRTLHVFARSPSRTENGDGTLNNPQENPEALDSRLSRYRRLLCFIAYRMLRNHKEAEDAVRNCLLTASYNVPRFECEGVFRSWLVRILIDEALLILHKKGTESKNAD
jgi:DNA-directed RNA polymerase specialized sigma24 family protein